MIFETLTNANLDAALNRVPIYTWGNSLCCLPQGATSVYLLGDLAPTLSLPGNLNPGDFLLFEEVLGPVTGLAADANPAHRQVVRLTAVTKALDPLEIDPTNHTRPTLLTQVTWAPEDALMFPLCLSAKLADASVVEGISVARGNLVLADHGETVSEWFPGDPADPNAPGIIPGPRAFRFRLQQGPLSFRIAFDKDEGPSTTAASLMLTDPHTAVPEVTKLDVHTATQILANWTPVATLLESHALSTDFAVETENDGRALIRFGDGVYGLDPPEDAHIFVQYRIGVGTQGNVGADSLAHVINPGFPALLLCVIRCRPGAESIRSRSNR